VIAAVQDDDAIGRADRGQAVGDDQGGAVAPRTAAITWGRNLPM
jgi:hypothetical protein